MELVESRLDSVLFHSTLLVVDSTYAKWNISTFQ